LKPSEKQYIVQYKTPLYFDQDLKDTLARRIQDNQKLRMFHEPLENEDDRDELLTEVLRGIVSYQTHVSKRQKTEKPSCETAPFS
jgi:hypothetical protein